MNCERCAERPGVVHYTEFGEGASKKQWICTECARGLGFGEIPKDGSANLLKASESEEPDLDTAGLADIADIADIPDSIGEEPVSASPIRADRICPECGLTGADFGHESLFGCPHCYAAFDEDLDLLLKRLHGATTHRGRVPRRNEVEPGDESALRARRGGGDAVKPIELATRAPEWLDASGPSSEFVLSSRVRLARNVADTAFPHRAGEADLARVLAAVTEAARATPSFARGAEWDLDELAGWDRRFLVERHLASVKLAEARGPRGVCVAPGERLAVMVNEEDHLRIQSVVSGLDLETALRAAVEVDRALETRIDYAVSPERGYLTACPTNVGTGMRASVLIHLPGLVLAGEIRKVHRAVAEMGMAVRGWFGEGSQALGDFHQISNQRKLGWTEEETIEGLGKVCRRILDLEVEARTRLVADPSRRRRLEDRVHRSWALLRSARLATVESVMASISDIRLGKWLNLFESVPLDCLNRLAQQIQPAHLGRLQAKVLEGDSAEWARALAVRAELAAFSEAG